MITIITPTYNEAGNIQALVEEVHKSLAGASYELLVMDDDSPDGTAGIVRNLSADYPVRVIVRKENKGLAPAVFDGFRDAKGSVIGVIDADLSHPPQKIPALVKALEKADIAVASRLVNGGGTENWPRKRKITSYIATMLARPLTRVKDPMSGFFFLRKDVLRKANLKPRGYKILLEILVKGKYQKAVEVPFIFKDRTAGTSKLNIKTNIDYLRQLLNLYFYKIRRL